MIDPKFISIESSRDFLKQALQLCYPNQGRRNVSDFSRRAGFRSRSYLSELLAGKKGYSRDSLMLIKNALKVPKPLQSIFELLVYRENQALRPKGLNESIIERRLAKARSEARGFEENNELKSRMLPVLGRSDLLQIYAALGKEGVGATLNEISKRSSIEGPLVRQALLQLVDVGAVFVEGTRYVAKNSQLDLFGLRDTESLARLISEASAFLQTRHREILAQSDSLVFHTAFSINSVKLPAFREQLRSAIFEVLDRFQDDEGDTVQQLTLGSYNVRGLT
jgi:hypothetical protein